MMPFNAMIEEEAAQAAAEAALHEEVNRLSKAHLEITEAAEALERLEKQVKRMKHQRKLKALRLGNRILIYSNIATVFALLAVTEIAPVSVCALVMAVFVVGAAVEAVRYFSWRWRVK